ncbi:MAG: translation initiation factor IF-2 [Candidatus Omnitrophica bacterium]|nr:translation initiation factor IF-2 [Candidatus Omnitrophota bacterium]
MATKPKKEKKPEIKKKMPKPKPALKAKAQKPARKKVVAAKPAAVKPVKPAKILKKPKAAATKPVPGHLEEKPRLPEAEIRPAAPQVAASAFVPEEKKQAAEPITKTTATVASVAKAAVKPFQKKPPVPKHPVKEHERPAAEIKKPETPVPAAPSIELKDLVLELPVTVKDLAVRLQEKPSVLIKMLMGMKIMAGINQTLEETTVSAICAKFGCRIKKALNEEEQALKVHDEIDRPQDLRPRPPIVTFMGHVDHGKTSLLDAIRKTKVVDSEHGGITQHIGAYRVKLPSGDIAFLDTPGHEAFTAMRARGASVTDMVVLVVAADDGIMPQTREAIDHARAAGVSIIVAINKIDKPQADIDRVKKQLAELNLLAEDWGGKTIVVPVSAKTGEGIDNLLEMILLEAQMLELKANPARPAKGIVIEAKMSKGRGPVATLLIQNGTLHLNDNIIVGNFYAKVRGMFNDHGVAVTTAPPSYPVEILGLTGIPPAGEQFFVLKDDRQAKELAAMRQEKERVLQIKEARKISLEDLYNNIKEGKIKELKLIIKSDVQGSLEAIKDIINKLDVSEVKLEIIHDGVGNINSSDVILAVASNALILGFNIKADDLAKELSAKEGVEIRIYNIIYELANEIKLALEGMLEPKLKRIFLGRAEVRKVFKLSRSGTVAGSFVTKGKISRNAIVNLVRNGEAIFEGKMSNLKRFKDDVREVAEGFECGISLAGYENLQEGDVIEAFDVEKIARKL